MTINWPIRVVLASASPRRFDLLSWSGFQVQKIVPDIIEQKKDNENHIEYTLRISYEKALAVKKKKEISDWIIAADTIVVLHDTLLEKPVDHHHARQMLKLLNGNTHEVYSSYCLFYGDNIFRGFEKSMVTFCHVSDFEIDEYVKTNDPLDKAGAYGIQGRGAFLIDHVEGSYTNVMGLPLSTIKKIISYHEIESEA